MIVRWGLAKLPKVLGELGIQEPLLVASERWAKTNLGVRTVARWTEVPSDQVAAAAEHVGDGRSEERRVGKECTIQCRSRWSPYH